MTIKKFRNVLPPNFQGWADFGAFYKTFRRSHSHGHAIYSLHLANGENHWYVFDESFIIPQA